MGKACEVCGGCGKFSFSITEWSAPNATPQGYVITTKSIELPCKACNGKGRYPAT